MPDAYRRWVLAFVISLGFMARLATLHSPLLDHHSWRQADGGMIARNFYREGLTPLAPQTDARGAQPRGDVATGLELHALLFAAVARLTGFAPEVGRAISVLCFIGSAVLLWGFLLRRHGDLLALLGVGVYALGLPLVLYAERSIWNEPVLIFLSLLALRAAQAQLAHARAGSLAALILSTMLIGAIKPQWLIILAPIAALWIEIHGVRGLFRWDLLLLVVASCATAGAFLVHMRVMAARPGVFDFGAADKLFQVDDMSGHFVFVIGRRLVRDIFGPVGAIAWIVGIVSAVRQRRLAEVAGFAGFLVYLIVVSRGNRAHDYYQLAAVPAALITLPEGLLTLGTYLSRFFSRGVIASPSGAAVLLGWTMILFAFGRAISFHSWYEVDAAKEQLCHTVAPLLAPSDRVVFASYKSPDLLYCLDRKGWLLTPYESTRAAIEDAIAHGAAMIVVPKDTPLPLTPGAVVFSNGDWTVYRAR